MHVTIVIPLGTHDYLLRIAKGTDLRGRDSFVTHISRGLKPGSKDPGFDKNGWAAPDVVYSVELADKAGKGYSLLTQARLLQQYIGGPKPRLGYKVPLLLLRQIWTEP